MDRFILISIAISVAIFLSPQVKAGSPNEAHITRMANDVQLVDSAGASHPATVGDQVDDQTVVQTGKDSSGEVTFSDETVVRLAADTAFSFKKGTREMNLGKGAVLIQAPKQARRAKIHAANVTAAIAGTTSMLEYHPGVCKFLVLEGTSRLYRPGHLGDSVLVEPGQMIIGNPKDALSDPVDVDIGRFVKTSRFLVDHPPLRSEESIAQESQKQQREKAKKVLIDTNLVIFGGGTVVSITNPAPASAAPAEAGSEAPSASADLGSIQAPPSPPDPVSSPVGLPVTDQAANIPR